YEYELARQYGNHIIILRFDEEAAGRYISFGANEHWAVAAMSSYWIFHGLLPEEVDRIIAIEADTVVVGDLSELYATDFAGAYVVCPGPEHKPKNHRDFMAKIGGDCMTFVLSLYDVKRIRQDFTLEDILSTDAKIRKIAGNSMMELTFGLLFAGKIQYVPGRISCIDENERYIAELGYDYIVECEKTAKIIHFSSYGDYSKPWNPVFLVPGYGVWWKYAVDSPYYKEYIENQWQLYNKTRKKQENIAKNITYRNVLLCTLLIMTVILMASGLVWGAGWTDSILVAVTAAVSLGMAVLLRKLSIVMRKVRNQ
ncbi:MAG: hypothetical protein NC489_23500, partial [Ruminococcus flavefaciens]|nr:hypothetical protein [Ruminococcus flavefaciens]